MENFWDKRYAGADYFFGTKPAAGLIVLEPHLVAGGKTLVVADGEGRNSVYLASMGYDVRATDYSQVAQTKAKALANEAGVDVDFVLSDIYDPDWSARAYDNVVAIFIQFVPPERMSELFSALARATRARGTLLIHGYTPEQVALGTGGPGNRDHMYTPDMLAQAFSHMQITVNRAYTATLDEGRGHSGPSALIDFVAKG
jgi:cyclopropane fatty-acyl-phospholipid synthase-like methyltransferase